MVKSVYSMSIRITLTSSRNWNRSICIICSRSWTTTTSCGIITTSVDGNSGAMCNRVASCTAPCRAHCRNNSSGKHSSWKSRNSSNSGCWE